MGFDQYHEPPDELPAATRTFARLCASLTEEAEAIGWYEQRLAVETDAEAAAIMRDAQGEEFKHFSMDLEFLLRRTPLWREIAQGILFQGGDIVAHGEAAEESAVEGAADRGEPLAGSESLGIGSVEGGGIMSHLLREHAPITATGWDRIDQEARERLTPALAARKLIDFAGPHGWEHSATNLGRTQRVTKPPAEGLTAVQREVLPLAELRAPFAVSRAELADADRGAEDIDLAALDAAARALAVGENTAVFHGWKGAGITGIAQASTHQGDRAGRGLRAVSAARGEGGRGAALGRHRRPVRDRAGPRRVHARAGDQRARRLPAAGAPARDRGRAAGVGARRRGGGGRRACAAATSCSTRARTSRSATWHTTRTPSSSTWKRASASGWSRPRPRCRSVPR